MTASEKVTVEWTAPSGRPANDWIGLFKVGDPNTNYDAARWFYTGGATSGSVRISRTLGRGRTIAAVACAAVFPIALAVPALVALTLIAAVWVGLHAYELIWWREARAEARALRE